MTELADLTDAPRAIPPLDDVNRPFWTGGRDGQLLILRCDDCKQWVHPPVAECPSCGGALHAEPVSGRATVFTFTVNHHPFNPAVPVPYAVGIVELEEQADLRVVTNNLNVAATLADNPRCEVIVCGGQVRPRDRGIIGEAAVDFIRQFRVDIGLVGISSIETDGTLRDFDFREVKVAQAIIAQSREVWLVADHSKFTRRAMVQLAHLSQVDVLFTDAPLTPAAAQQMLSSVVDETFNCVSVDGHMSTNDTVLLLANGAAGGPPLEGAELERFRQTLHEVCGELSRAIPTDGEGATHLVTVEVHGCRSREDALRISKTIADSPLVKTAIAGADPNWGRIVSAAGYAGVPFDPSKVTLHLNGLLLYERGSPVDFDADAAAQSIAADRDTSIVVLLEEGSASARFWTTDLTAEYVRLNADYHT